MKKIFKIKGMHCASCAGSIEHTVKKIEGVADANVNFASEKLFVDYHHDLDDKIIIGAVKKTGYQALPNEGEQRSDMDHSKMGHNQTEHDHAKMQSDVEIRDLRTKLTFSVFASIITIILIFGGSLFELPKNLNFLILIILATPVEFWVGAQFWRGAYYEFKNLRPGMDSLVVVGTAAAYFFSLAIAIFNFIPQLNHALIAQFEPYFDVSVVVITFIILGRFLEAKAKGSASEAIKKLLKLQAKIAHFVDVNGNVKDINISDVKVGDILLVKQGEKIPVDGVIVEGNASINESMVSGESLPIDKKEKDEVIGATINQSGIFKMKAVKIGKDTFLAQIIKIVEEAQASKAPIQRLADKITEVFVPIVMGIAILTFIMWMLFGPQPWLTYALVNAVAVLVVACPCALGLATPIAIIAGTGKGAENGIIIRNAQSLEVAGKINTVVLDKTGTITKGEPAITEIISVMEFPISNFPAGSEARQGRQFPKKSQNINSKLKNEELILQIAASLGANSTHPLDKAVTGAAHIKNINLIPTAEFMEITGKGIKGKINGTQYFFGNKKLFADNNIQIDEEIIKRTEEFESKGETTLLIADSKMVIGIISVADMLKESAKEAVEKLKKIGMEVWMITGDNEKTAKTIAQEVGIENILASVLPEQKSKKIKELQEKGKVVAMVGDGINDAPALTQANIGIAIGTGTDIAIESAGITLVSGDPLGIYKAILLSKSTLRNIKQNLFWAYAYNIALIPVAAGVLYIFGGGLLNPMLAGGAMAFSSLSVVLNSLRLKRIKFS